MDKKINILLTEVLPRELPYFFSNKPLIKYVEQLSQTKYEEYVNKGEYVQEAVIPLNFYSYKDNEKKRILTIPHMFSQLNYLFFLEKYNRELINYFSLNDIFSIRSPKSISKQSYKTIFFDDELDELINPEEEKEENKKKYNNFFYNGKYQNISKFYDSAYLRQLEKQFSYLKKLDIKKCFYNIYTHSIDWAYLGDKKTAKSLKGEKNRLSFQLDKILQNSNYGETNGIIVGPEFSRIAAEVILAKVDFLLFLKLKEKNLKKAKDYNVVRYVDDYFIFSNTEEVLKIIKEELEEILNIFNLSLNDSKTTIEKRPFFKENLWVPKLQNIVSIFHNSFNNINELVKVKEEKEMIKTRVISMFFNRLILEMKELLINYENSDYKIISYFFSKIDFKNIIEEIDKLNLEKKQELKKIIIINFIETISYILSFSLTSTNITKYCSLLKQIRKIELDNKIVINNFIFIKIEELIEWNIKRTNEIYLLLSYLKYFDNNLKQSILIKILSLKIDYFSIISILYYISNPNGIRYGYKTILKKIKEVLEMKIKEIEHKKSKGDTIVLSSEDMYLLHDLSLCNHFNDCLELMKTFDKIRNLMLSIVEANSSYLDIYRLKESFIKWDLTEDEYEEYSREGRFENNYN